MSDRLSDPVRSFRIFLNKKCSKCVDNLPIGSDWKVYESFRWLCDTCFSLSVGVAQ